MCDTVSPAFSSSVMKLHVIRGHKPANRRPPVRFDWEEFLGRRRRAEAPDADETPVVIPLLEGWVRLMERQLSREPRWVAKGETTRRGASLPL